jgi:hypothetical protein
LLLTLASVCADAQEVKYLDLTAVSQRTTLRFPPAPSEPGIDGGGVGSGSASVLISDGAADIHDPRALGAYLENVSPHEIDPAQPFEAEFRILNTGLAQIEVPVSPHLADLQPEDESTPFEYLSIALEAHLINADPQGTQVIGSGAIELYGCSTQDGTIVILKPGEWIRVKAKVKLRQWPSQAIGVRMRGEFLLRRVTYRPHPGGSSTKIANLYPNHTPTPSVGPFDLLRFDKEKP